MKGVEKNKEFLPVLGGKSKARLDERSAAGEELCSYRAYRPEGRENLMARFSMTFRRVGMALAGALLLGGGLIVGQEAAAAGPNFCKSEHHWELYYDGYVQVQAGRQYTPDAPNWHSRDVKSKSYRFWDSWGWNAPMAGIK